MSLDKATFVISLCALSFLYGAAVGKWEWFPHSFINQATDQARTLLASESSGPTWSGRHRFEREGARTISPDRVQPGLTLVSSSWKSNGEWTPELRLMAQDGQVLHRWSVDGGEIFGNQITQRGDPSGTSIHGAYLYANGDVLVNLEYVGMARIGSCGNVRWSLGEGNHHSIARADNGSFWGPAVWPERRANSERYPDGFPGLGGKKVWVDRILNVSEEGEVLRDINVLDVLYENSLERYIPKVLGGPWPSAEGVNNDITPINDVEPLSASLSDEYPLFEAGDLLVSLRSLSLVFVFDPETLRMKWHASDPLIYQHDPDFTGGGWIGVFDNNQDFSGGRMLGGSRIVEFQPHTDSVSVRFPTPRSPFFYTGTQGKWQRLENGNMLLTETNAGRALEVDSTGEKVWEWIHSPYGDAQVPAVTKAHRTDLTRDEVATWNCSSVDSTHGPVRK